MEQWLEADVSAPGCLAWLDTESIFHSCLSSGAQVYAVVLVAVIC